MPAGACSEVVITRAGTYSTAIVDKKKSCVAKCKVAESMVHCTVIHAAGKDNGKPNMYHGTD